MTKKKSERPLPRVQWNQEKRVFTLEKVPVLELSLSWPQVTDGSRGGERISRYYRRLAGACDVGLIFLDHRFTIPNFPSRLLSYLEKGMPVLCATDEATDVGTIAEERNFGWRCSSGDAASFSAAVDRAMASDRKAMATAGRAYLEQHYHAKDVCREILAAIERIG